MIIGQQLFSMSLVLLMGILHACNGDSNSDENKDCLALACKLADLKNVSKTELKECRYAKNWKSQGPWDDMIPVCPAAFEGVPASYCNHFIIFVDGEAREAQPLEGCTECNYKQRTNC